MNQGMAKQNLFERFELLFWNLTIRVLSGSRSAHTAVSPLIRAAHGSEKAALSFLLALCGMAGLASGYLFFVITH